MVTVGSYEAKTRLPQLLRMVGDGERIMITRHGHPIALLIPAPGVPERSTDETIQELAEFGKGRRLGPDLSVEDLIEDGRR
jgi:prevent-host-death family protein